MRRLLAIVLGSCALLWQVPAAAVTAVNPFGVNVASSGPTTVFLTFQSLDANEVPVEAFWCGELTAALMSANPNLQLPFAVQTANPCVPGTIYGRLPVRLDRSRTSTSGAFSNLTDIMTIPASVSRRAYQDAIAGKNSAFFYVRRFTGGVGGDKFVIVTCRMAGGGARVALALLDVRLAFETARGPVPVLAVERDTAPPPFAARIVYNGTGTLRGRWEVVLPGDPEPSEEDLLTEATLPVERRGLQRRYTLVERFSVFLPPTGKVTIPGPDPQQLPHRSDGPYKVLLRIEASDDKEATSNTGDGRLAIAGGVAGFPMPVLRYYVGSADVLARLALAAQGPRTVAQFLPLDEAQVGASGPLAFQWVDVQGGALYRLEVRAADEQSALEALVRAGVANYEAPPWLLEQRAGQTLRWRVVALDAAGNAIGESGWRSVAVRAE
ncbi:MAG: hypothetical protein JSW68_03915 [Burkholderiales bacterium]|nr:MAG: hypothetical protein JSW68_03915 [Burkholderiales bacterium]